MTRRRTEALGEGTGGGAGACGFCVVSSLEIGGIDAATEGVGKIVDAWGDCGVLILETDPRGFATKGIDGRVAVG